MDTQSYRAANCIIVPIREEDKMIIMQMRNEQLFHLRQEKPLTVEDQEKYFRETISPLFEDSSPPQLLFSYLENNECIGYGGLVHINRRDAHAEISFIMKTELQERSLHIHWSNFLSMIGRIAFDGLGLHKIFTYAFDIRPELYPVLLSNGFSEDARLKDHCRVADQYRDVVIHSLISNA